MDIHSEHFVDAGEQDANGLYDYYYEGNNYTFSRDGRRLVLRTYVDDPTRAFFVGMTCGQVAESALVADATGYLAALGVSDFLCLGEAGMYQAWTPGE